MNAQLSSIDLLGTSKARATREIIFLREVGSFVFLRSPLWGVCDSDAKSVSTTTTTTTITTATNQENQQQQQQHSHNTFSKQTLEQTTKRNKTFENKQEEKTN